LCVVVSVGDRSNASTFLLFKFLSLSLSDPGSAGMVWLSKEALLFLLTSSCVERLQSKSKADESTPSGVGVEMRAG
jgi:hypothetical protein